ncbi:MAG TPA: hypothetical protein VGG05_21180 [Pseudonocardiaceae bacterium]
MFPGVVVGGTPSHDEIKRRWAVTYGLAESAPERRPRRLAPRQGRPGIRLRASEQGCLAPDYVNGLTASSADDEDPNAGYDPHHPLTIADTCH